MRTQTTLDAATILSLLMATRGVRERDVIAGTDITAINSKKRGAAPITLDDIDALARFFGVPKAVFLMTEPEFYEWLAGEKRRASEAGTAPGARSGDAGGLDPTPTERRARADRRAGRNRCSADFAQPRLPGFEDGVWIGAAPLLGMDGARVLIASAA